jgi:hypothetical protein
MTCACSIVLLGQNSRIKAGCEQRQPASVNNINTQTCLQQ